MNFIYKFTFSVFLILNLATNAFSSPISDIEINYDVCDDLTSGGVIQSDQAGCNNPTFDPELIVNVMLPSGGTGDIEYLWIMTTDDPTGTATWTPIADTNFPEYDPDPISVTTHYRRCARRSGCDQYLAESNYVTMTIDCQNASIGDYVWEDHNHDGIQQDEEPGLEGVTVLLEGFDLNGNPYSATTTTNISGLYSFTNIPAGEFMLTFTLLPDMVFSPMNTTTDDLDSDVHIMTGKTDMFTVLPGSTNYTYDAGMYSDCNNVLNGGLIGSNITNCGPLGMTTLVNVATPSGGQPDIEYQWYRSYNDVPFSATSGNWFLLVGETNSTIDIPNSTQDAYYVRLSRSLGCTTYDGVSNIVSIIILDNVEITYTTTDETCNGAEDGNIDVTVTQGAAPYNFQWNPDQGNNASISNLAAGWYYLTVTDDNNCSLETLIDILPGTTIELSTTVIDNVCYNGANGSATVSASGGLTPYTYQWDANANNQTTQTATNLAAGSYSVEVTDANGCSSTTTVVVGSPLAINVTANLTQTTCNESNGAIDISVEGGTPGYTYLWSNNQTTEDITNLSSGNYSVTITDQNNCTKMATFEIMGSSLIAISMEGTDISCYGANDGTVTANVTNGTSPYTYVWSNTSQTTSTINNLSADTYSVTVTDASGCSASDESTINQPQQIVASANVTQAGCGVANGAIDLSVNGGQPNYTYLWSNSETTQDIDNLVGGLTYSVTITDQNNCSITESYSIQNLGDLTINTTKTDVICNGQSNGTATVNILTGQEPYTYQWDGNANNQTTQTATNLAGGIYSVTVTDNNGCSATADVSIDMPYAIVITGDIIQTTCNQNNGSIDIDVTGGTGSYTYLWSNTSTSQDISNLSPNTYSVTVTDSNGCTQTESFVINASTSITAEISGTNLTCADSNNGEATVNITNGVAPYTYEWTNTAQTTATITNLSANTYAVTVTDNNGCVTSASVIIESPTAISASAYVSNASCGINNGAINLTVSGGTGSYSYLWSNNETTQDIDGLASNLTYSVTITDDNNCTLIKSYDVEDLGNLSIDASHNDVNCYGYNDGNATVIINSGVAPYSYQWGANANNQTTQTATNLTVGTYSVTVTDSNGCSATTLETIFEPGQLICSASVTSDYNGAHLSTIGACDGSATINVTGGTAPYTYLWNTGATSVSIDNLCSGTYTVDITDANGCTCTSSIQIFEPCIVQGYIWEDTMMNNTQDGSENGIPNVEVDLTGIDINGNPVMITTTTDANGNYIFDPILPGSYNVNTVTNIDDLMMVTMDFGSDDSIDSDFNPTTGNTNSFNINNGETMTFDGGFSVPSIINTISIGDFVWLDVNHNGIQDIGDPGQNDVLVTLVDLGPDMIYGTADDIIVGSQITETLPGQNDGYYIFNNVPEGKYVIVIDENTLPTGGFPDNISAALQDVGTNDNIDSDINDDYVSNVVTIVPTTTDITNLDAGFEWLCNPLTSGGEIEGDELLCGTEVDPSPIISIAEAAGGYGPVEYIWMYTTDLNNNDPTTFTPIPSATGPSYDPGIITQTTLYIRCARNHGCVHYTAESNFVLKTVQPLPDATILEATTNMCLFESANFEVLPVANATYQWTFGTNSTPTSSTVTNPTDITYSTIGYKGVNLEVTLNGCVNSVELPLIVQSCGLQMPEISNFTLDSDKISKNTLTWTVQNEFEHTLFFVERSKDNDVYELIGQFDGRGASNQEIYEFVDNQPRKGDNYYRIRQHSFAIDDYNYSNVLYNKFLPTGINRTAIFPNPFFENTQFEVYDEVKTELNMDIVDLFGKIIETRTFPAGTQTGRIDMKDYPDGVYLLYFRYNDFRKSTQKIIKVK